MGRREAVAAMRLLARALVLRRAPASEWSPDDRITLDAFLRTPTGGRFYDALALLAVTAALRGVEERPFDAIYKGHSFYWFYRPATILTPDFSLANTPEGFCKSLTHFGEKQTGGGPESAACFSQ